MTILFITLFGLFIYLGYLLLVKVVWMLLFGNSRMVAEQEATELRNKIEKIDEEVMGKKLNEIRIRFGLPQM